MTDEHKKLLRTNIKKLAENMRVHDVLNDLMERDVVNFDDKEMITRNGNTTSREKAEILIQIIVRKNDSVYQDFIISLQKTNQKHVANILLKAEADAFSGKVSNL